MDELKNKIPVFALEGSAFAGKTTLLNFLRENYSDQVITIPEVGEYVGGDKNFPNVPFNSLDNAKSSTHFFIEIELQRYRDALALYRKFNKPVVMDRFTFLSSLIFYRLLKKTNTQEKKMFSEFYSHAHTAFSNVQKMKGSITPTGLIFIQVDGESTFKTRLSRGTKNSVFTEWESCQYVNSLYKKYINHEYPESNLVLSSKNDKKSLVEMSERIIQFMKNKNGIAEQSNPFGSLAINSRLKINLDDEFEEYSQIKKRARNLMNKTNLN